VVGDLNWASGTLNTIHGPVTSSWSRSGDSLRMEVTIPVGSTAEVYVPKQRLSVVTIAEGGKTVWNEGKALDGVTAHDSAAAVMFEIGSGTYVFERTGM
jgi:alpha-L-rhamnosidase